MKCARVYSGDFMRILIPSVNKESTVNVMITSKIYHSEKCTQTSVDGWTFVASY